MMKVKDYFIINKDPFTVGQLVSIDYRNGSWKIKAYYIHEKEENVYSYNAIIKDSNIFIKLDDSIFRDLIFPLGEEKTIKMIWNGKKFVDENKEENNYDYDFSIF